MNTPKMMRSLMWKDIRIIRPLVLTAVITAVVANLLVYLLWRQGEMRHDTMVGFCYTLWILLPGFVALGVPAMIIGTEHDTGTEKWLRALPVPWHTIARAKLWAAAGAVLVTGAVTTTAFFLVSQAWDRPPIGGFNAVVFSLVGFMTAISVFGFFIALLLLLGFVWSYLIRSSLISMLALVPTFILSIPLASEFGWRIRSVPQELKVTVMVLAAIGVLATVWALQMLLAWRRYQLPLGNFAPRALAEFSEVPDYRPSYLPVRTQPSQVVSLLWQQLRQTGPISIALVAISTVLAFCFAVTHSALGYQRAAGFLSLIPLFILLSASWLGAIVFYGDTLRRRCAFFADRGISPTQIWWTRMFPPAVACLILLALIGLVALATSTDQNQLLLSKSIQVAALMVVLFAFGQLVSQWVDRPLLAFLAAPAYAFVSLTPVLYMLHRFDYTNFAIIVLIAPVLIFATWRLTRYWLIGPTKAAYTAQVLGYTAVAVLVPCLWIVFSRFIVPISHHYAAWIPGVTP